VDVPVLQEQIQTHNLQQLPSSKQINSMPSLHEHSFSWKQTYTQITKFFPEALHNADSFT
jgi:hypothetical protein